MVVCGFAVVACGSPSTKLSARIEPNQVEPGHSVLFTIKGPNLNQVEAVNVTPGWPVRDFVKGTDQIFFTLDIPPDADSANVQVTLLSRNNQTVTTEVPLFVRVQVSPVAELRATVDKLAPQVESLVDQMRQLNKLDDRLDGLAATIGRHNQELANTKVRLDGLAQEMSNQRATFDLDIRVLKERSGTIESTLVEISKRQEEILAKVEPYGAQIAQLQKNQDQIRGRLDTQEALNRQNFLDNSALLPAVEYMGERNVGSWFNRHDQLPKDLLERVRRRILSRPREISVTSPQ